MLFSWPARIVAHIGPLAVVQVPGGLLGASDPRGWLVDGSETTVIASDPTHAQAGVVFLGTYRPERVGDAALLRSDNPNADPNTLLLIPSSTQLPESFTLSIPVRVAAQVDPDEEPKPFGSPPPNCCPDLAPDDIHALLPCCCPDVDPHHIHSLVPGTDLFAALQFDFLADLLSTRPTEPTP